MEDDIDENTCCTCPCGWSGYYRSLIWGGDYCPKCESDQVEIHIGNIYLGDEEDVEHPDDLAMITTFTPPPPYQKPIPPLWKEGESVLWGEDLLEVKIDHGHSVYEVGNIQDKSVAEANEIIKKLRDGQ